MVHGFFVILRAKYKKRANKYDMNLLDIILLAVALAMDCFTVSIVSGVIDHGDWHNDSSEAKIRVPVPVIYLRMAFLFGLFQALMPLLGWLGISHFQTYMEAYDHWIAFGLLGFIGGKMIWESFGDEEDQHFNPRKLRTQLLLAVATSIDALAIGISFACTGFTELSQLTMPLLIIGIVSFLFSIFGYHLGRRFGKAITRRLKPELFGGIILVLIGLKILLSHLLG
jgi:putative Mn2+ efflux pump MntP